MGGDEVVIACLDRDVAIGPRCELAPLRHIACMPRIGSLANHSSRGSHILSTCNSLTHSRCWLLSLHIERD